MTGIYSQMRFYPRLTYLPGGYPDWTSLGIICAVWEIVTRFADDAPETKRKSVKGRNTFSRKVMYTIFWDEKGILVVDYKNYGCRHAFWTAMVVLIHLTAPKPLFATSMVVIIDTQMKRWKVMLFHGWLRAGNTLRRRCTKTCATQSEMPLKSWKLFCLQFFFCSSYFDLNLNLLFEEIHTFNSKCNSNSVSLEILERLKLWSTTNWQRPFYARAYKYFKVIIEID